MNMIQVFVNISMLEEFTELLKKQKLTTYQIHTGVLGVTPLGSPRMNTPVWPGYNAMIFIPVPQEKQDDLIKEFEGFNDSQDSDDERISVCSWNLDVCTGC